MKIDRLLPRDMDDIVAVLSKSEISKKELDARFNYLMKFTMASHKENFMEKYKAFNKQLGQLLKP